VVTVPEVPKLVSPTAQVRVSYLTGEQADCQLRGIDSSWLGPASEDFESYLAERQSVAVRWGVPTSIFWYVAGEHYIGTLVIRHELTSELLVAGGHIGYHVVAPWRRQGHATRMLEAGIVQARQLGLGRVLLTCNPDNVASIRVIIANGGYLDEMLGDELRYWIDIPGPHRS
jgi:predicted acetyltransferase